MIITIIIIIFIIIIIIIIIIILVSLQDVCRCVIIHSRHTSYFMNDLFLCDSDVITWCFIHALIIVLIILLTIIITITSVTR